MAEIPVLYSNVVAVETGPFDILLRFGLKRDRRSPVHSPEDEICHVYLSPEHAKALARILKQSVDEFERARGPIPCGGLDVKTEETSPEA